MVTGFRRLLRLLIPLLLLGILAACGSPSSSLNPQDGGDRAGSGIIAVKMHPQAQVTPEFGEFTVHTPSSAAPRALHELLPPSRMTSFTFDDLTRSGMSFNSALPLARVMMNPGNPQAANFEPDWTTGSGLDGAAYCIYDFNLPGYAASGGEQTLGLNWLLPAVQKAYIGLGNSVKDTWDWFENPADGVLTLDSFAPYQMGDGSVLVAVVVLGMQPVMLNSLHVGQQETRGTGDMGIPTSMLTMLPPITSWPILTDKVDLSPGCSPINDQGQIDACTAFANADSGYNYELKNTYGPFGWDFSSTFNRCSPRYVYNQTGVDLGGSCPTGGRICNEVGEWLLTHGTATEQNAPTGITQPWAYDCTENWSAAALADAALLMPESKTFIGQSDGSGDYWWIDSDIDQAKHVLKDLRHVIVFRTNLDSNFQYVNYTGGKVWNYNGSYLGGHAMCIVGYDTGKDGGKGAFKVRNSWGSSWGAAGYCWVGFTSMKNMDSGVYGYYFTEECNSSVIARFIPGGSGLFWPCITIFKAMLADKIHMSWEPLDGATGWLLYRDNQDTPLAQLPAIQTSFDDMSITDNNAHVYWLVALDPTGMPSDFSLPAVGWLVPAV